MDAAPFCKIIIPETLRFVPDPWPAALKEPVLVGERLARSESAYPLENPLVRKTPLAPALSAEGAIQHIPNSRTQADRFKILLDYLIEAFTPGLDCTEKEVNGILRRFHEDVSGLRRELVGYGLLEREGGGEEYWRTSTNKE
jgi:hypothetical protein